LGLGGEKEESGEREWITGEKEEHGREGGRGKKKRREKEKKGKGKKKRKKIMCFLEIVIRKLYCLN
jgi:hypothetical protein